MSTLVHKSFRTNSFKPMLTASHYFDRLPLEIQGCVLQYLPYEQLFQLKPVSRNLKAFVEGEEFQALPSREKPTLTACYFFIENEIWQWGGFDPFLKKWRRLPSLTFLPADCKPDPDLFHQEFLVCAKDGLVFINFSKSPDEERLIVFNPLSKRWRELPPLKHRRNPMLMHMLVDPVTQAYHVIVAGSCRSGDENLSKITEVFDSRTAQWKRTGDLPGPVTFALNEYQSGVCQDGKLFCIGSVKDNDQVLKGIIGYDIEEGRWLSKWTHALSFCMSCTILQLVESSGEVYLFSERENGRCTEHWVDRLDWILGNGSDENECMLINVIKKEIKSGGWSLEVYPEYTCIPYSEGQLYIFNANDHSGVVYDIRGEGQSEVAVQALPRQYTMHTERIFNSLYPMSFTVEPRFSIKIYHEAETAIVQTNRS